MNLTWIKKRLDKPVIRLVRKGVDITHALIVANAEEERTYEDEIINSWEPWKKHHQQMMYKEIYQVTQKYGRVIDGKAQLVAHVIGKKPHYKMPRTVVRIPKHIVEEE